MVPLAGANQSSSNSGNSAADGACNNSAIRADLRLGALSVLAAWQGKVSELLSQAPGCSRTTCFISFEAEYEAVAAPEPAVAANPGEAANATAPVWRKGRDLKVDIKTRSGGINGGDGSGGGSREGRIAAQSSSLQQEGGQQQGSGKVQRSEWQAWLAPFKEMQLEPVQVRVVWCVRDGGKDGGKEGRERGCG